MLKAFITDAIIHSKGYRLSLVEPVPAVSISRFFFFFFCLNGLPDHRREAAVFRDGEAEAQTPEKEEEEGS